MPTKQDKQNYPTAFAGDTNRITAWHTKHRELNFCLLCADKKEIGLKLCWVCHRKQKAANDGGYRPELECVLEAIDNGTLIATLEDGEVRYEHVSSEPLRSFKDN